MKGDSLFALIAGAAAGLTLGLLFAPEKGRLARRDLKDLKETLTDQASEIKDEARMKILAQLDKLEKALSKDPDEREDEWYEQDA